LLLPACMYVCMMIKLGYIHNSLHNSYGISLDDDTVTCGTRLLDALVISPNSIVYKSHDFFVKINQQFRSVD
jgi:hypothetical protein